MDDSKNVETLSSKKVGQEVDEGTISEVSWYKSMRWVCNMLYHMSHTEYMNKKKGPLKSRSDLGFDHGTSFVAFHSSIKVVDQNHDADKNMDIKSAQSADRAPNEVFDGLSNESECSSTIEENIKAVDFQSVLGDLIIAKEEIGLLKTERISLKSRVLNLEEELDDEK
ncbi:unnamed protein product [Cochlearia groenlandica]